ncbi:MAG TPA: methyltransferase domain-containing protein [Chthoniobacterales bacterium]|nr:methyltransferase domain-containing protein [Chthoniobacterales bacterium]
MSNLLIPGRHLVNTRFQERYFRKVAGALPEMMPGLQRTGEVPAGKIDHIIFAITSSNQSNARYNPIPFHVRAISVDRFARSLALPVTHRLFGIPHYGHNESFARLTVKEIRDQSEGLIDLAPSNCLVLCSTPEVIKLYQELGFSILTAEQTEPETPNPIDLVRAIAEAGEQWADSPFLQSHLAGSTISLFFDFPEVPQRIIRLYRDPLTNQEGSLTEKRNYNSYARGMNEILRLKYLDIAAAIRPGRIVDEGCADGGLLAEVAHDFPDSDLYGIDLSAEFSHRFEERRRAGDFGGTYVHFFLRNLLDPIFDEESIDTTICNSTLHELWSYAEGARTVNAYLREKFRQLRPGGRLIIRDVVGPEEADADVILWCNPADGNALREAAKETRDRSQEFLARLSTENRFLLFIEDFLRGKPRRAELLAQPPVPLGPPGTYRLSLRLAAEFLSKKDYTDNWSSEMNEEFCFWSFAQWKMALSEAGFQVIESAGGSQPGSRIYGNPWIVDNRFKDRVRLASADEALTPIEYPPTNMVVIAEKPRK